jgi:diguanylate cyclase (GGDEF)-like protein
VGHDDNVDVVGADDTEEQQHTAGDAVLTEALARCVLAAGRDLILLCDETHRLTFVGPDAEAVFGRTPALGEYLLALVHADDRAALAAALGGAGRRVTTCRALATGGSWRIVELTTVAQPDLAGTVCAVRDITDTQEINDRLAHDASHDGLTSLANRTHLLARLEAALDRRAPVPGKPHLAVLYLDLDGFKRINDTFGHAAGDDLLVAVANRLRQVVRPGDTVARLGGDEFVVVADRVARPQDAEEIARRIRDAVSQPVVAAGRRLAVTTSIGIAFGSEQLASELLNQADVALYRAKQDGRNRAQLYSEALMTPRPSRQQTEGMLRAALDDDGLMVVYQPVVDLAHDGVVGYEALLRLRGDDGQLVPAAAFIDVAEETGLITSIGAGMLDLACREATGWPKRVRHPGVPLLSVNLSPRQLADPRTGRQVERTLDDSGLDADLLCVEVPETALSDPTGACRRTLARLKDLGVLIAVDEFGGRHAGVAVLRDIPLDILKLDRRLIAGLDGSPGDPELALAVIRMGQTLGLATVATGVETGAQAATLRRLGCDRAQGYWFGHPTPARALTALVTPGAATSTGR